MEEFKNENMAEQSAVEEPAAEQRPSTKYGRTAYQQQMQEEQAVQGETTQAQPVQEQRAPESNYQYNAYTPYEEAKPEVKNWHAYVLMVLVAIEGITAFAMNMMSAEAYNITNSIEELVDAIFVIAEQPLFIVVSTISDIVGWATIVFFVLDIIQLYKGGKKITGAILFAIFLRPAYFIWRAHLLGQKKTGAIIYTVACYGLSIIQYVILFAGAMEMVMRTM